MGDFLSRLLSQTSSIVAFSFVMIWVFASTDNDFTGAEVFEFDDSKDTYWSGNIIGDACKDGSRSSFASGSDSIPSC